MSPQPTIAVVVDEPETRTSLASDLRQRYTPHYAVLELGSIRGHAALTEVETLAVVITTVELDGDVPRRRAPRRRTAPIPMLAGFYWCLGQWASHPVRRAMVLGEVDGYLFVPWLPREQWLHLPMTEYLADGVAPGPPSSPRSRSSVGHGTTVPTPCVTLSRAPACRSPSSSRLRRGARHARDMDQDGSAPHPRVPHRRGGGRSERRRAWSRCSASSRSLPEHACDVVMPWVPDRLACPRRCTPPPRASPP